jgi:hypothetical protein
MFGANVCKGVGITCALDSNNTGIDTACVLQISIRYACKHHGYRYGMCASTIDIEPVRASTTDIDTVSVQALHISIRMCASTTDIDMVCVHCASTTDIDTVREQALQRRALLSNSPKLYTGMSDT